MKAALADDARSDSHLDLPALHHKNARSYTCVKRTSRESAKNIKRPTLMTLFYAPSLRSQHGKYTKHASQTTLVAEIGTCRRLLNPRRRSYSELICADQKSYKEMPSYMPTAESKMSTSLATGSVLPVTRLPRPRTYVQSGHRWQGLYPTTRDVIGMITSSSGG